MLTKSVRQNENRHYRGTARGMFPHRSLQLVLAFVALAVLVAAGSGHDAFLEEETGVELLASSAAVTCPAGWLPSTQCCGYPNYGKCECCNCHPMCKTCNKLVPWDAPTTTDFGCTSYSRKYYEWRDPIDHANDPRILGTPGSGCNCYTYPLAKAGLFKPEQFSLAYPSIPAWLTVGPQKCTEFQWINNCPMYFISEAQKAERLAFCTAQKKLQLGARCSVDKKGTLSATSTTPGPSDLCCQWKTTNSYAVTCAKAPNTGIPTCFSCSPDGSDTSLGRCSDYDYVAAPLPLWLQEMKKASNGLINYLIDTAQRKSSTP